MSDKARLKFRIKRLQDMYATLGQDPYKKGI